VDYKPPLEVSPEPRCNEKTPPADPDPATKHLGIKISPPPPPPGYSPRSLHPILIPQPTMPPPSRAEPNIIITGTPGVGKTSLAELVAQNAGLTHLRVNDVVKEKECHEGWDERLGSWVVDEEKVRLSVLLMGR